MRILTVVRQVLDAEESVSIQDGSVALDGRKLVMDTMDEYGVEEALRLREAAGEEIGANCDLSHLFWQQCNAVEVIRFLGKQGAIYHAHMKDTAFFPQNVDRFGVLNFGKKDDHEASEFFRAVGYGHGASTWKDIVAAYMEVGYNGMLSIENEDPILSGEVGVQRSLAVLKNVREEIMTNQPNPG